jgi:hypothetical protein
VRQLFEPRGARLVVISTVVIYIIVTLFVECVTQMNPFIIVFLVLNDYHLACYAGCVSLIFNCCWPLTVVDVSRPLSFVIGAKFVTCRSCFLLTSVTRLQCEITHWLPVTSCVSCGACLVNSCYEA